MQLCLTCKHSQSKNEEGEMIGGETTKGCVMGGGGWGCEGYEAKE